MTIIERSIARISALQRTGALEPSSGDDFVSIAKSAAATAGASIAAVNLLNLTKVWIKAAVGLTAANVAREDSFCTHVVEAEESLWVADALLDARFVSLPAVTGELGVRFYCGAPIRLDTGVVVGAVCVLDRAPRAYDPSVLCEVERLADLAGDRFRQIELEASTLTFRSDNPKLRPTQPRARQF